MTQIWFRLTDEEREKLKRLYKELTGEDYVPPKRIEGLKFIEKFMKEKPNSGR